MKLRLAAEQPHAKNLIGHLERAEAQTDHPVRAYLIGDKISIEDARPIDRSMMTRRMAPPMYQLARTGPAECAGPTPAS